MEKICIIAVKLPDIDFDFEAKSQVINLAFC